MRCIIAIIVQRQSFDAEYVRRLIHSDPETERDFVSYFGELLAIKLRSRLRAPEVDSGCHPGNLSARPEDSSPVRHRKPRSPRLFREFRLHQRPVRGLPRAIPGGRPGGRPHLRRDFAPTRRWPTKRSGPRSAACSPNFLKKIARSSAGCFSTSAIRAKCAAHLQVDREYLRVLVHRAKQRFRTDYLRRVATKTNPRDTNGMSMQHQQALATKASERYLLGEMSEPERFEFEAHYFDCPACAEDVRTGAALARGIKAVCAEDAALRPHTSVVREVPRRGWFSWLSPAALVPSTAALALGLPGCLAGLRPDSVPTLGERSASALADCVARRRARRGTGAHPSAATSPCRRSPWTSTPPTAGDPLTYDLIAPGGAVRHQRCDSSPAGRFAPDRLPAQFGNSRTRGLGYSSCATSRAPKSPAIPSPYNSTEELDGSTPIFTPDVMSFADTLPEFPLTFGVRKSSLLPVQGSSFPACHRRAVRKQCRCRKLGQVGLLRLGHHQRPRRLRRCRAGSGHHARGRSPSTPRPRRRACEPQSVAW